MAPPSTAAARCASGALLLGLNLVGHALRVLGVPVALLGTATALQLVLEMAPDRRDLGLVDNVVDEADISQFGCPPPPTHTHTHTHTSGGVCVCGEENARTKLHFTQAVWGMGAQ